MTRRSRLVSAAALAAGTTLLLAACGGSTPQATAPTVTVTTTTTVTAKPTTAAPSASPTSAASTSAAPTRTSAKPTTSPTLAHWTYEGEDGPDHWADLDPAYSLCGDGKSQSPIDITTVKVGDAAPPVLRYKPGKATVTNNGHTIQADAAPGSVMVVDGVTYPLLQMHFHAPSENTLNAEHEPIELHFVHKTADGKIAVLGVMVKERAGAPNVAYAPLVKAMSLAPGKTATIPMNWPRLVPTNLSTYRFDGSLTTPPCTEGVKWYVASEPITLGAPQVAAFEKAYTGNNRPVQPLNGRTVTSN